VVKCSKSSTATLPRLTYNYDYYYDVVVIVVVIAVFTLRLVQVFSTGRSQCRLGRPPQSPRWQRVRMACMDTPTGLKLAHRVTASVASVCRWLLHSGLAPCPIQQKAGRHFRCAGACASAPMLRLKGTFSRVRRHHPTRTQTTPPRAPLGNWGIGSLLGLVCSGTSLSCCPPPYHLGPSVVAS
jgi:hypothetical protein